MDPKELPIIEHIEELRKRLIICAVFFVIALIAGFYVAEPIIKFIQHDNEELEALTLNAFKVSDPLTVYLEVSFFVALILTSPVILYQLWAFIAPGLYESERKATLKYIPYSFVLFLVGLLFSYFILFPNVMNFMMNLSERLDIQQTIGINEYFSFLFKLVIPFGFLFQLPVITLFLSRLGVLNPNLMSKFRKYSYFVLFVIAVLISPPDLISYILMSIPLFVLYEISIAIAKIGYKKYLKAEEQRMQEEKEAEQRQQVEAALAEQRRLIEQMKEQN
ncbi:MULTISPECIES: twin-arginine translocase subunit TatC [Ureibacillus]|uniref:Sec-independent protein translocase protein TatC n=1 Tax=Ureibacillus thermosphaericus TaxID=51173 RepID=A0A840PTG7_URETH|nr:twin-arginine translocase subunit TatC [Ureibacillus thermosphaericus]MBB5149177.1 sec-independent protein translocase protein TatC [Ureibacillus thermosphaericus]NKZ31939.1 twin-arginine translocase subunit TatC [Ureibacillus thermosphaericus]